MSGRLLAGLAVLILAAGCTGSANPTSAPASMPGPTATTPPAPAATPTATPTAPPQVGLTGPLGDGRQIHTATLLADGGVLVAGGYALGAGDTALALASAVRYDPTTNMFSPTGSMAKARGGHTGTLLPDGKVLIAGGGPASWTGGDPTFLAAAELYDPKTSTFKATGPMSTPRESHTATLLSDGRVLIAGGGRTSWITPSPRPRSTTRRPARSPQPARWLSPEPSTPRPCSRTAAS